MKVEQRVRDECAPAIRRAEAGNVPAEHRPSQLFVYAQRRYSLVVLPQARARRLRGFEASNGPPAAVAYLFKRSRIAPRARLKARGSP